MKKKKKKKSFCHFSLVNSGNSQHHHDKDFHSCACIFESNFIRIIKAWYKIIEAFYAFSILKIKGSFELQIKAVNAFPIHVEDFARH